MDDGKQRRVRADAQGERQRGRDGEGFVLPEQAKANAQIVKQEIHGSGYVQEGDLVPLHGIVGQAGPANS